MSKPLVSIIIPTYNVERYIEECIDSLLNQTYQPIEIIVIDDGSKDATLYLLKQYQDQIQLISHTVNKGQGARRNEGLKKASGKYVYFVDSDDWIEKQTVEAAVSQLEKTGADLVRFNGQAFADNTNVSITQNSYSFHEQLKDRYVYDHNEALEANRPSFNASPCLYITKRAFIEEHQLHFPESVLHEDEYFTVLLFMYLNKMTYLNETYYFRRYRSASTMTEKSKMQIIKSFDSYVEIFKQLETIYNESELDQSQKVFLKRQLLSIYNGLRLSPVNPQHKKVLRTFKTVSLKDRLFIMSAHLKQKVSSRR